MPGASCRLRVEPRCHHAAKLSDIMSRGDRRHCRPSRLEFEYELVGRLSSNQFAAMSTSHTATKLHLKTIPRSRVYTEVARQLQDRIVNELRPGDMLPSERELVQMLGVSRSSVRDAIRSLELMGLLQPLQGVGTVVRDPSAGSVAGPIAGVLLLKRTVIHELLDVRKIIEPALARRAAEYASPEQIAKLETVLDRQERKIRHGQLAIEEDSEFHYGIALGANNSVLLKVVDMLMELLKETRQRSLQVAGRQEKSLAGHRLILAALQAGDASAAEAAMHQHLSEIETIVLQEI